MFTAAIGSPVAGLSDSTRSPWVLIHSPAKAPGFSASRPRESRRRESVLLTVSTVMERISWVLGGRRTSISYMDGPFRPRPAPRPVRGLVRDARRRGHLRGKRGHGAFAPRSPRLDRHALAGSPAAGSGRALASGGPLGLGGGERGGFAGPPGRVRRPPPPSDLLQPARSGRALLERGGEPP